jgi:iron complex transport system substrate-binding protein
MTTTRPRRLPGVRALGALATAAVLLAAGCGGDDDDDAAPSATATATVGSAAPGADPTGSVTPSADAFPVTFETKFGTTTIEDPPQRVVSVGYTEADLILALGVTPVAIRDWYGEQPNGLWPWAAESQAAQAGPIEVIPSDAINYEQVAGLRPDVIFAIGAGIEQAEFDKLSAIAPVVAQTDEYNDFGTPWDVTQLMIGEALGLEAEAQALVDDVEGQIDAVVEAHPGWQGRSGVVAVINADGSAGAFTDGDNRGHMLTQLGFAIPEEITTIAGESFYADISAEQIGLLDTDLLVYTSFPASERPTIDALPLVQGLSAIAEGRNVFLDDVTAGAMSFSSTLSIPYALDLLVPQIEQALAAG